MSGSLRDGNGVESVIVENPSSLETVGRLAGLSGALAHDLVLGDLTTDGRSIRACKCSAQVCA